MFRTTTRGEIARLAKGPRVRHVASFVAVASLCACAEPNELRVVAQGRYIEVATARTDPICGGTLQFMDAFVESGFALLGEAPPDEIFIRFEWLEEQDHSLSIVGEGRTRVVGDGIVIRADRLVHEHELAHAVHLQAWPVSAPFLHEGLAVLLDAHRGIFPPSPWPAALSLDEVLGAPSLDGGIDYAAAYYLVSQIVLDHGTDGLRALWESVPAGTSAEDVRATYQALFGESIEVLLQPWIYEGELSSGIPIEITRLSCDFAVCPDPPLPWRDDVWSAVGPSDCLADDEAIGPGSAHLEIDFAPVWRQYTIEFPYDANHYDLAGVTSELTSETIQMGMRPCWPRCAYDGSLRYPRHDDGIDELGRAERYRVEIGSALEDLPVATPGELVFRRPAK